MTGQGQLFVIIVILLVGIAFGAGVAWWIASSRKSNPVRVERPAPVDELSALRERFAEQVGLWQEKTSGKLVVRMENQMVGKIGELKPGQRARLEALALELQAWLGGATAQVPAGTPAPAIILPAPQVEPEAAVAEPSQPAQRAAPVVAVPAPAPAKPLSIVEQINDILQAKLAGSSLSQKGIRLAEDPVHGVVVWIGLEHYAGVDGVKDPEVRAILREAAQEWERSTSPGKK
jgi:hypothetical protein